VNRPLYGIALGATLLLSQGACAVDYMSFCDDSNGVDHAFTYDREGGDPVVHWACFEGIKKGAQGYTRTLDYACQENVNYHTQTTLGVTLRCEIDHASFDKHYESERRKPESSRDSRNPVEYFGWSGGGLYAELFDDRRAFGFLTRDALGNSPPPGPRTAAMRKAFAERVKVLRIRFADDATPEDEKKVFTMELNDGVLTLYYRIDDAMYANAKWNKYYARHDWSAQMKKLFPEYAALWK
jgi:hypothetical protein